MVREERTRWRDTSFLSKRHRDWGTDCYMLDIDFCVIEFKRKKVVAVIEYKSEFAPQIDRQSLFCLEALAAFSSDGKVPFFVVHYSKVASLFRVESFNKEGLEVLNGTSPRYFTESRYVNMLHFLRGKTTPEETLDKIEAMKIPEHDIVSEHFDEISSAFEKNFQAGMSFDTSTFIQRFINPDKEGK